MSINLRLDKVFPF